MEELAASYNAYASFHDIEINGPPGSPLGFPDVSLYHANRVNGTVYDRERDVFIEATNITYRTNLDNNEMPDTAFWIQRKLKKAIYGCVRSCMVLRRFNEIGPSSTDSPTDIIWEITNQFAAVKIMDWDVINENVNGMAHREDPLKEIAAMQLVKQYGHGKVMDILDVMTDDNYLYLFMPYCNGGELFNQLQQSGRFSEPLARYFFKQVINGLSSLQRTGVCHRDMSLENILVHENDIVIIDLGMCLRVPFAPADDSAQGQVDVTSCTLRRLMSPQGQCGKPNYISPEVLVNREPFDGFTIDTWAAGVILFILLVGLPPWDWATPDDARFRMIALDGQLGEMLKQWGRPISPMAENLLQGIFRWDPRRRMTFGQVMDHPWVRDVEVQLPNFL